MRFFYNSITMVLLLTGLLHSENMDSTQSPVKQLAENLYQLGNITINTADRTIKFPAEVNMEKGLIEVFVCGRGGKTHESIFVTDEIPYYLQVALLMIGLENADQEQYRKAGTPLDGDRVQVYVSLDTMDNTKRHRADALVWNMSTQEPMKATNWVFIGSQTINGTFMADEVKSIITTYNDPTTLIDNPLISGKNDELYSVYSDIVPAKGTPVIIHVEALP